MRERGVRHLPVVVDGKLVGVVSQRDLYLLETLRGVDVGRELVEEAMSDEPFVVAPDAPLEEVAEAMANQQARLGPRRRGRHAGRDLHVHRRAPRARDPAASAAWPAATAANPVADAQRMRPPGPGAQRVRRKFPEYGEFRFGTPREEDRSAPSVAGDATIA